MRCKLNKQSMPLRDKDVLAIGAHITDKAHIAEMNTLRSSKMEEIKMSPKRNLFYPTRDYIMGNSALEEKMFQRVIRKRNRIKGGLHHLTYIVKARCKMKKLDISLGDARKVAWRLMLITSQSRNPPKPNKSTRTAIIQGVQTAIFRIPDPDMKILFGT